MKTGKLNLPTDCREFQVSNKNISYKECRKNNCCGKYWFLGLTPIFNHMYGDSLDPETKEGGISAINKCADTLLDKDNHLNKEAAEKALELVVNAYRKLYFQGLENCLAMKTSVKDCVLGCSSLFNDGKQHVHPHQRRPYYFNKAGFDNIVVSISEELNSIKGVNSLDELIVTLRGMYNSDKIKYQGFGSLARYDAALRLSRLYGKWNPENNKKVYIHAGVFGGANALWNLNRLVSLDWLNHDFSKGRNDKANATCDISEFHEKLQSLHSHHLENLLCCFHIPFLLLENAVRVRLNTKLRNEKFNNPNYKNKNKIIITCEEDLYNLVKPADYPSYHEWSKSLEPDIKEI